MAQRIAEVARIEVIRNAHPKMVAVILRAERCRGEAFSHHGLPEARFRPHLIDQRLKDPGVNPFGHHRSIERGGP